MYGGLVIPLQEGWPGQTEYSAETDIDRVRIERLGEMGGVLSDSKGFPNSPDLGEAPRQESARQHRYSRLIGGRILCGRLPVAFEQRDRSVVVAQGEISLAQESARCDLLGAVPLHVHERQHTRLQCSSASGVSRDISGVHQSDSGGPESFIVSERLRERRRTLRRIKRPVRFAQAYENIFEGKQEING
jgi:hypothetical protein